MKRESENFIMRGIKKEMKSEPQEAQEEPQEDLETPAFIRRSLNKKNN